jgi:hypothetical protein
MPYGIWFIFYLVSDPSQYCDPFTAEKLPLDGDFDGANVFQG